LVGKTPVVRVCMKRGGYNVLSMVTPKGEMKYSVTVDSVDSVHYIEFLKNLIRDRERPLILLVDRISFHRWLFSNIGTKCDMGLCVTFCNRNDFRLIEAPNFSTIFVAKFGSLIMTRSRLLSSGY
jgi:hypothetical protein